MILCEDNDAGTISYQNYLLVLTSIEAILRKDTIAFVLNIQHQAWNNGHDNYGASIDVKAAMLDLLEYFKHLNPAQKAVETELKEQDELKYAKPLCAKAHKAVRHFVVTLK